MPSTRSPPDTITVTEGPTQLVLRCAWEFPSAWWYSFDLGNALASPKSMSLCTSGSVSSFMVMPAVVCREKTMHTPSSTPLRCTASRTCDVMSHMSLSRVLTSISVYPVITHSMSGGYIEGVRHTRAIHMAYRLETIGGDRARELRAKCSGMNMHSRKADINGVCVQLNTANKAYVEMWSDNFYHMSDSVRSHAMIYCLDDPSTDLHVEYHVESRTAFLFNFDYYGWVKSIALGLAGNILEDSHSIYSVHGAALDIDGAGVTLIAPSKTGKTTQSWGLLRMENSHLITDDWYFVKFGTGRPRADGSEKNCYIDADIGDVWEEYKALVQETRFDNKGRGIANVRWVTGEGSVIRGTKMRYVFLLKRDYSEAPGVSPMEPEDALEYLKAHDYCNPHQLLRDEARMAVREAFFRRYLSACEVYMVNTTLTAEQTQAEIRKVLSEKCGARRSLPRVRDLVRDLHRVLADVAAEHEYVHPVLLGTAEPLAERGVGGVVGHEAPHAAHLHDEHRVGLVPLADAGLEAPDVLEAPLRGRVREAAHPVPLEGDALHLCEDPPAF